MFTMSRLIKEEAERQREKEEGGGMQIFATFLAFDQFFMSNVRVVFVVSAQCSDNAKNVCTNLRIF